MTPAQTTRLAASGSLALLLGAFAFQHIGGLAPCTMCIWQRYPHVLAVLIGVIALRVNHTWVILAGASAAFASGAVGAYHAGVEQGWWQGPTTCTAGPVGGMSPEDLLNQILSAPLVRCDDIAWQMMGISMAGWNAIISFGLMAFWLSALNRR